MGRSEGRAASPLKPQGSHVSAARQTPCPAGTGLGAEPGQPRAVVLLVRASERPAGNEEKYLRGVFYRQSIIAALELVGRALVTFGQLRLNVTPSVPAGLRGACLKLVNFVKRRALGELDEWLL